MELFFIIDGKKRFLVAKELGIPIYFYFVKDDFAPLGNAKCQ